jgi:hypothetical protein
MGTVRALQGDVPPTTIRPQRLSPVGDPLIRVLPFVDPAKRKAAEEPLRRRLEL